MSGIAAIIDFDNTDIGIAAIQQMTSAMAYRGPDGLFHRELDNCVLGFCSFHTTSEALEADQPLLSEDSRVAIVFDGFVSNYEDLRRTLLSRGAQLRNRSDAELVLHAYETWGEDCPKQIEGEFALVVWDSRQHTAFAAIDHAGLRPLHYYAAGRRVVIATDIATILALEEVPRQLNYTKLAELAADSWFAGDGTIWQGIQRLAPAQTLQITNEGSRTASYWSLPLAGELNYATDTEYIEHYRDLLRETVRRYSRANGPIAVEASGGLDSSSIFALAHELDNSGKLHAPRFLGFTYSAERGSAADEAEYASLLERHVGRELHRAPLAFPGAEWFVRQAARSLDCPPLPNMAMSLPLIEAMKHNGCRVALNGIGGDQCLNGSPLVLHELLRTRAWQQLADELRDSARGLGLVTTFPLFLRLGLYPAAPAALKRWVRRRRLERELSDEHFLFWLSDQARGSIRERRRAELAMRGASALQNFKLDMMCNPFYGVQFAILSNFYACREIESRSPMLSRPYMEFCAKLPQVLKRRHGIQRYIHREAMRGQLPDAIVDRHSKAEFTIAYDKLIEEIEPALARNSAVLSPRLIDRQGVETLLQTRQSHDQTAVGSSLSHKHSREIWGVFAASILGQIEAST